MKTKYKYLLFDGRYITNSERAICLEICDTIKEARTAKHNDWGEDTVIVKFELTEKAELNEINIIE